MWCVFRPADPDFTCFLDAALEELNGWQGTEDDLLELSLGVEVKAFPFLGPFLHSPFAVFGYLAVGVAVVPDG